MPAELTKKNLRAFAELFIGTAEKIFERDQHLYPVWFLEREAGSISLDVALYGDQEQKEAAIARVKRFIKDNSVVRVCHIFEGWMLEAKKTKDIPESIRLGGRIASHPDRQEAVAIIAEDRSGNSLLMRRLILRPKGQDAVLASLEVMGESGPGENMSNEGLLTNLFKD